ncbi:MAG: hypothetical protein QOJ44_1437 [Acidimicrobiaceae bacterium]|nr:hypothetical protein [Acidimicrobiaceae bacterium]
MVFPRPTTFALSAGRQSESQKSNAVRVTIVVPDSDRYSAFREWRDQRLGRLPKFGVAGASRAAIMASAMNAP